MEDDKIEWEVKPRDDSDGHTGQNNPGGNSGDNYRYF